MAKLSAHGNELDRREYPSLADRQRYERMKNQTAPEVI